MNLSDLIRTWLAKPDNYAAGLKLLTDTGSASALSLKILARGADSFTRPKLQNALRTWLESQASAPAPAPAPGRAPAPDRADLVAPLKQQTYRLLDERTELKARLRSQMDNPDAAEDRRIWALRILAITRELDDVYSRIDFGLEHGYLPLAKAAEEPNDDRLSLSNVRTYISRYRKKLGQATTDQQRASYAQLLQHYEAERKRLEQFI